MCKALISVKILCTTPAQMKMFLTRIGFGSKAVITGDATQKDLAPDAASGLDIALKVLRNVEEIGICELTSQDVVRQSCEDQRCAGICGCVRSDLRYCDRAYYRVQPCA